MILAIESSCDDSSVSVTNIETKELLFHKKISQEVDHCQYGGVVPELAARLHATALPKIIESAKEFFPSLKAIAVTNEPGLTVSLAEGVMAAKALSLALDIPLIPIHHLKGHIYSLFINKETLFPIHALITSGGHTQIVYAKSYHEIEEIGTTMDDSIGESFDKVAKMLGLGYPGGPIVEKRAKLGDESSYNFPVPLMRNPDIAFSYSGLKNSVRVEIEKEPLNEEKIDNICASFQKSAVRHITHKTEKFFERESVKNFAVVGGVSANIYLREKLESLCKKYAVNFLSTDLQYTADNAAMIGRAAIDIYGQEHEENFKINSRSPLRRK